MSRSEAVETFEKDGFKAEIFPDECSEPPHKYCDMAGVLVTWHRSYGFQEDGRRDLGFEHGRDWLEAVADDVKKGKLIYINVAMIDHSGISFYESTGAHAMDPGGWDSGQIGFLYTDRERWNKYVGGRWTKAKVLKILRDELEMWNQYVTGDIYYIEVTGPDGEDHESCGGFWGFDYAKEEAKKMLDDAIEYEQREIARISRMMAL